VTTPDTPVSRLQLREHQLAVGTFAGTVVTQQKTRYKKLTVRKEKPMRWFTSDLHFGHTNIIRYCERPFITNAYPTIEQVEQNVADMNESICANINAHLNADDELWILGDLALGNTDQTLRMRERINANKVTLIPGNHDKCHPMHKKADMNRQRYEEAGYIIGPEQQELTLVNGTQVLASHFPYSGESQPGRADRYSSWRPNDEGSWLLCGHVHDAWQQRGRAINVGVDAWGGNPVNELTLIERIAQGPADHEVHRW
jgi:calcineurin-like phosphoesterase family protein